MNQSFGSEPAQVPFYALFAFFAVDRKCRFKGYVPNVVYSCGSLVHGRQLGIPRAMSDDATTAATLPLDKVLAALE